jgi:hypothetical protein
MNAIAERTGASAKAFQKRVAAGRSTGQLNLDDCGLTQVSRNGHTKSERYRFTVREPRQIRRLPPSLNIWCPGGALTRACHSIINMLNRLHA